MLNRKFTTFNSRTNHSRDVVRHTMDILMTSINNNILQSLPIIIIGLIMVAIGIYGFILPSIKCAKKNLTHYANKKILPIQTVEIFALIVMPILGYIFLYIFKEEAELLDWNYIVSIWVLTAVNIYFYFFSRKNKFSTGPLTLVVIPSMLIIGIIIAIIQFIHFSPFLLYGSAFMIIFPLFSIFVFPIFSLIQSVILLSTELYSVLQLNKQIVLNSNNKSKIIEKLANFYFGKNALIAQLLTFPIFLTVAQFLFIILTEKPDSIIQAFLESSDGIFSQGINDNKRPPQPEYICTIAAYGNSRMVKPLHYGIRGGKVIRVTRQLKICNAFEEVMEEKYPKTQRFLRKQYDNLQIPIDKWKTVTIVSNILYIIIKPMEWFFLIILYLVCKNPETKIGKQYLQFNIKNQIFNNGLKLNFKS